MADTDRKPSGTAPGQEPSRLTPADRAKDLLPWRRAKELRRCYLYWLPVRAFPIPSAQRSWLLEFFERWSELLAKEVAFRGEVFLQYKTLHPDLMKPFLKSMMEFVPILGLGRRPGAALPVFPSESEIEATTKSMFESLKREEPVTRPDAKKHMPDYAYWFSDKSRKQQLDLFFGYAGMAVTYLKMDSKAAPPPLPVSDTQRKKLPMFDWAQFEKSQAIAHSLSDAFLAKSKQAFGAGLEKEPQIKGIPFILPLLDSADFFSQPAEVIVDLFKLFEVYMRESPADKGMLLAFQEDHEEALIRLLDDMKKDKLRYPEA